MDARTFSLGTIATTGLSALALLAVLGLVSPQSTHAQQADIQFPLTVSTDNGNSEELTLGLDPEATEGIDSELGEEERPPVPPGFDARLIDDDIPASGLGEGLVVDYRPRPIHPGDTVQHEISFQAENLATKVTISWDLPQSVTGTIEDKFGSSVYGPVSMSGSGSMTVDPGDPAAIVTLEYEHQTTIMGTDGTGNDTGWRMLAPPSGATRADLEDNLDFNVDSGALLRTWDGTQWVPATSSSESLPRGNGFILYFSDDNTDPITADGLTLNVPDAGEGQTENVTVDGLSQSDSYHLLGNPYDVAFDLGQLAGGDLSGSGFQNTVQVWDPSGSGQWTTITQGGTDDNVAAWQGFFVERSQAGSGQTSLTFDANGRQSGLGDLIGSKSQPLSTTTEGQAQVELALTVESSADTVAQEGVTLLLHTEAETSWDAYEASQLPPPNGEAYATVNGPLVREGTLVRRTLASEPFPTGSTPITIPLSVHSIGVGGTATLRWPESERDALPSEWGVELIDTATGTPVDLRSGSHSFELEAGDGTIADPDDARFDLRVTPSSIPVELAGLRAQHTEEAVRLTWQTASETNNAGFYVQRKRDGARWQRLGFVESKANGGTTSEPKRYRFRDAGLPYAADSLIYRLRQVDTDGTVHFSDEITVRLDAPEQLALQPPIPNPVRRQATLRFETPKPMRVQVTVYDLLGRKMAMLVDGRLNAGRHTEQLSAASLAPGVYFVRLRAGDRSRTRKLTIVR
jgi:hypothetical protein